MYTTTRQIDTEIERIEALIVLKKTMIESLLTQEGDNSNRIDKLQDSINQLVWEQEVLAEQAATLINSYGGTYSDAIGRYTEEELDAVPDNPFKKPSKNPLFSIGKIGITRKLKSDLSDAEITSLIQKHLHGFWGHASLHDQIANWTALPIGDDIDNMYHKTTVGIVRIVTYRNGNEAESQTMICYPHES